MRPVAGRGAADGYEHDRHFVVVQGVTRDLVLIGDPSLGSRIMDRKEFEGMWNNILFVVNNKLDRARGTFNTPAAWRIMPRARFDEAALSNQELSRITIDYSITPNYY